MFDRAIQKTAGGLSNIFSGLRSKGSAAAQYHLQFIFNSFSKEQGALLVTNNH
jgi:hypothetical protein